MLEPERRGLESLEAHGCVEEWVTEKSPGNVGKRKCAMTGEGGDGYWVDNQPRATHTHFPTKGLHFKKGNRPSHLITDLLQGSLEAQTLSFPSMD